MKIGVVVPCYNPGGLIDETLARVQAQTYTNWVGILVNDGSTDPDTEARLAAWARQEPRLSVHAQPNAGVAVARNNGAALLPATDALLFLDQDDLWTPDALATLAEVLAACPNAPAAYGNCDNRPVSQAQLNTATLLREGNPLTTPGQVLLRRAHFTDGFSPRHVPADDWQLWLCLSRIAPLVGAGKTLLHWRQHARNASRDREKMYAAEACVLADWLARPDCTPDEKDAICYRQYRRTLAHARRTNYLRYLQLKFFGKKVP